MTKRVIEASNNFNWEGINFPTPIDKIHIFEKNNPEYGINVLGYNGKEVYPARISKKYAGTTSHKIINLLLITNEDNSHYMWLKNVSRLLTPQASKHHSKRHFCLRCFNHFYFEKSLKKHIELCLNHDACKLEMPVNEDGTQKHVEFKNIQRQIHHPFAIYADMEYFPEKLDTCTPNPNQSYTLRYQKHKVSGYDYVIKGFDDNLYQPKYVQYTAKSPDEDISKKCFDSLKVDIKDLCEKVQPKYTKSDKSKRKDRNKFNNATKCYICNGKLGDDKVWDHCHFIGKYRGAAHAKCNLEFQNPKFIPVFFHNLSRYDAYLSTKSLTVVDGKIDCIPKSEENYISFSKEIVLGKYIDDKGKEKNAKREIRFLDLWRFMQYSLLS